MEKLVEKIEPIFEDNELFNVLSIFPSYKSNLVSKSERLVALLDIYKIFIPNKETIDIYHQIYLSVIDSLEKKDTVDEIKLLNENFKIIKGLKRYGILGGLESFRITGRSGIGKSTSVQRCIDVICRNRVIKREKPLREIIPILLVECVADGSFKSLLYSILQSVDETLGTSYFVSNKHQTTTIDVLLSAVSNVLINHVALLVIDECERVANDSKKGELLMNYLTQLVNQSNISICFVGNESCNSYFQNKEYLARRTIGISIHKMNYDDEFYFFMKKLFEYQYVLNKVELNSELINEFYNLSNGLPSVVVALFIETQKEAILFGKEIITVELIRKVFKSRFSNMLPFVSDNKPYPLLKRDISIVIKPSTLDYRDTIFKDLSLVGDRSVETFVNNLQKVVTVEMVEI